MDVHQFLVSSQSYLFKPIENWLRDRKNANTNNLKTIWIVGAPRTGTTLTYQILCKYFDSYYLTNRVAERYRISLFTRLIERFITTDAPVPSSFKSKFGVTNSPEDPHEGGQFFYQFFPKKNPYTSSEDLTEEKKKNFQNLIESISRPQELFISKNTFHSLRIQVLSEIFPNSLFIWVRREIAATIYSIMKVRENLNIPDEQWWGIKPPGWEEANKKPVIEKIAWQVRETDNIIEADLKKMQASYIEASYEQVCKNPKIFLKEIENLGYQNYIRNFNSIPNSFSSSSLPEDTLSKKIKKAIA